MATHRHLATALYAQAHIAAFMPSTVITASSTHAFDFPALPQQLDPVADADNGTDAGSGAPVAASRALFRGGTAVACVTSNLDIACAIPSDRADFWDVLETRLQDDVRPLPTSLCVLRTGLGPCAAIRETDSARRRRRWRRPLGAAQEMVMCVFSLPLDGPSSAPRDGSLASSLMYYKATHYTIGIYKMRPSVSRWDSGAGASGGGGRGRGRASFALDAGQKQRAPAQTLRLNMKPLKIVTLDYYRGEFGVEKVALVLSDSKTHAVLSCSVDGANFALQPAHTMFPFFAKLQEPIVAACVFENGPHRYHAYSTSYGVIYLVQESWSDDDLYRDSRKSVFLMVMFEDLVTPALCCLLYKSSAHVHLLVVGVSEPAKIYTDLQALFSKQSKDGGGVMLFPADKISARVIDESSCYDTVMSAVSLEFSQSLDNRFPSLLLGTYSGFILQYHFDFSLDRYILADNINLRSPIYTLHVSDLNCDGVLEVVATTARGMHILQADLEGVCKLLQPKR